jgi:predicted pyridoxine 5'-phosphate oxidase superfamily flavin-nucleotide-binding protein
LEDDRTLLLPERAGNNLAFGLQNILANGRIGLIAFRPGTGETIRITGTASIHDDADLLAALGSAGRPALLALRVQVERCYFHCARSVLRAGLWDAKTWAKAQRVSFGKIISEGLAAGPEMAAAIDESVQGGYTTRLWSNQA